MKYKISKYLMNFVICACLFLNGCAAALPVVVGVGAVAGVTAIVMVVNLARDQYPDIDFDKPAPIAIIYKDGYEEVWNGVIDTLMEMKESPAMMDKNSGVIRTIKKNINDVSWIGKGLGKATFLYELNITVRKERNGVSVSTTIPFWEEKVFIAAKEKNLPEGSNMMRHIFYRNLNKRLSPAFTRMPDSTTQDIRYAPMNIETQPKQILPDNSKTKTSPDNITATGEQTKSTKKDTKPADIPKRILIINTSADIKDKPDIKARSIGRANPDDECERLAQKGNWLKVRLLSNTNIEGWIHKCNFKNEKIQCPQPQKDDSKTPKKLDPM